MINFRRQQLLAKIKPTYREKCLKKVMSDAMIMSLMYTLVKHIQMIRGIMKIVLVVGRVVFYTQPTFISLLITGLISSVSG